MGIVKCDIAISLDGYAAGRNQTEERPFGDVDEDRLHKWMFAEAEQHAAVLEGIVAAGAFIMGRNMFGPVRGDWDRDWRGWWGEDPPYHAPVFVLTHYPHEPLEMQGGTTFNFVTDGIESALEQARAAAGDADVAIAGGAATVNQYLAAGLLDELRLHVTPYVLGAGERLFDGVADVELEPLEAPAGSGLVTHVYHRVVHRSDTSAGATGG
jgi:dihydrofolate reductase